MPPPEPRWIVGWDVGGAHLKASLFERRAEGAVLRDVAQWPCPLWQGLAQLDDALRVALAQWPMAALAATAHAATMTGEMVDAFAHREAGVAAIAGRLRQSLAGRVHWFAPRQRNAIGAKAPETWIDADVAAANWRRIASANWLASARLVARSVPDALLVDLGSTTCDLIALRDGRVAPPAAEGATGDADRLASGELVYHGVVRTPLCAFAAQIDFRGRAVNLMNEFFATAADVYRLTGELPAEHDAHPSADGAAKDPDRTRQRLARMVGLDARDASENDWSAFAAALRDAQLAELRRNALRVIAAAALPAHAPLVAAGCGDFLVRRLAAALGRPCIAFGDLLSVAAMPASPPLARAATLPAAPQVATPCAAPAHAPPFGDAGLRSWAQVAAPSVAVAWLWALEHAEADAR